MLLDGHFKASARPYLIGETFYRRPFQKKFGRLLMNPECFEPSLLQKESLQPCLPPSQPFGLIASNAHIPGNDEPLVSFGSKRLNPDRVWSSRIELIAQ